MSNNDMADHMKETGFSSLSSGAAIYSVLKSLLGDGTVKPVLSESDVKLPLVTFRRTDVSSEDSKGYSNRDSVTFEFVVFSDEYGEGVRLAEKVRHALTCRITYTPDGTNNRLVMDCVRTVGGEESWQNGAFVQTLRLTYRVSAF